MSKPTPSPSRPLPSARELTLLRMLWLVTSRSSPEVSVSEFSLRLGLGRPNRELWRNLTNLELKGYLRATSLDVEAADGPSFPPESHTRIAPCLGRAEALQAYFTDRFAEHLGYEDDAAFLAALIHWAEQAFAQRQPAKTPDKPASSHSAR